MKKDVGLFSVTVKSSRTFVWSSNHHYKNDYLAGVCGGPVVEAAHDGEADGEAGGPAQQDDHLGGRGVVPVLAVQDRGRHREEPGQLHG